MTSGVRFLGDSGWRRAMAGKEADVANVGAGAVVIDMDSLAAAEGESTA